MKPSKTVLLVVGMSVIFTPTLSLAEPIRWFNGDWDERGAPQGKLLTDNGGWWGERPYKCNFLKLRDKALDAFGRVVAEKCL